MRRRSRRSKWMRDSAGKSIRGRMKFLPGSWSMPAGDIKREKRRLDFREWPNRFFMETLRGGNQYLGSSTRNFVGL